MNLSTTARRQPFPRAVIQAAAGTFAFALVMATSSAVEPGAIQPRPTPSSRQAAARTVVDPGVQPAGGAGCRECGPGGCRRGHACQGHHRDCRNGACSPYCPVRPTTFGYYGTQWRRWPAQGVVPVSNVEASTPVKPPKSAVPDVDEESFGPKPGDLPEPGESGPGAEAAARPMAPEPDASPEATPVEPAPAAEPREIPRDAEQPSKPADAEPAPAKPKNDNLFDDSAARKVRRKIPAQSGSAVRVPAERSAVKPTSHESTTLVEPSVRKAAAATRAVPRVAFDPRAEAARVRQAK